MISKEKRKLIDIALIINMIFWILLTGWLFMVFEPSIWFVFALFPVIFSFLGLVCNEPDYMEYAESLTTQNTGEQNNG